MFSTTAVPLRVLMVTPRYFPLMGGWRELEVPERAGDLCMRLAPLFGERALGIVRPL